MQHEKDLNIGMDIEFKGIIYVYNLIDLKILYYQSHADEVARDGKQYNNSLIVDT